MQSTETSSHILSFGIAFAIITVLSRITLFWDLPGAAIVPTPAWGIAGALLLAGIAFIRERKNLRALTLTPLGFGWGLVFLFFTDWLCRRYSLFQGPAFRGEILLGALVTFALLRRRSLSPFPLLPGLAALLLFCVFLVESNSRLLFSDDHTVFFFRLSLLKEKFPQIPFYYPLWNAGLDARDFFATGSLNLYFLTLPLIYLGNLVDNYNLIVSLLIFVLPPVATFKAARVLSFSSTAASIASLLSLSTNLIWYRWALKYGTMGFIVSASLLPLVLALGIRIVQSSSNPRASDVALFVATATLMLFWSPSAVALIPLGFLILLSARKLLRSKVVIFGIIALFVINIPWMTLFVSVSKVTSFVQHQETPNVIPLREDAPGQEVTLQTENVAPHKVSKRRPSKITVTKILSNLREAAISANPLLLMAIPGIMLFSGAARITFAATATWLCLLGAVLAPLKPQLELERMLQILCMLLCLPTGAALAQLFITSSLGEVIKEKLKTPRSLLGNVPALLCGGFLCAGPLSSASIVSNLSLEQYYFMEEPVTNMVAALKTHSGPGRVVFSGCVVHELNHGHLAPLTVMSGVPLVASSHAHTLWTYTQVVPTPYIEQKEKGVEEYLDLMNATAVMAHEPPWIQYFSKNPSKYERVWSGGKFTMYKRRVATPSFFLSGDGEISHVGVDGFTVSLTSTHAVLKYAYFPFLTSSACTISAHKLPGDLSFIELSNCPTGVPIQIQSKPGYTRIFDVFHSN